MRHATQAVIPLLAMLSIAFGPRDAGARSLRPIPIEMVTSSRAPVAQSLSPAPVAPSLEPTALTTEYKSNPLGIDADAPRLSWQLVSSDRGAVQSAYRIQVAATETSLTSGDDLIWDTGKIESDQSAHVVYEGPAPESRRRYYWRVQVWDGEGQPSPWSAPAWWEMGLLTPSDWEADWIEPPFGADSTTSQPSPMLRQTFTLDGDIAGARLYATSHGLYEIRLNGERVSEDLFTPGWTSYLERLQYQTYDVTELLQQGPNAIGAVLGDGWYRGYIGFERQRAYYGSTLALLAQIVVTYEDGSSEIIVKTDEGWTASTGPILQSDIYMGETYDARLEQPGWATHDFDDADWQRVRAADHPKDILLAPAGPPVREIQTLKPIAKFTTPEGDLVFDMGQNMVGWVRLRVDGPAGTTVTLRHAEVLDKIGNFYTENLRAARQTVTYTLKGEGTELYEPHFTFQGFRYVAVEGYPGEPTLDDLTGVVIHSAMRPAGHFESSAPLINQLQHNIVWGLKGNFLDVPTDCPQRDERLGWTGDAQVFAPTAAFNMDVAGFFSKWLQDLEADQGASGSIPHVIPNVLGDWGGATGWADAGVIIPWVLYQRYGDVRVLERQYESMKAWVEFMRTEAAKDRGTYIWDTGFHFGDWLAYSTDNPAYPGATTTTDLIATAYFAHSTDLLARTAELLHRPDDARTYAALRDKIVGAFQEEFITPRGRLSSDSQTAYVLALAFDLMPDGLEAEAASLLAGDVGSRGHLTTGFLGTPDLTHVLSEHEYLEEAYHLLLRQDYPSWLYPVTMGATTIWERWDGIKPDSTFQTPGMNSFNHYAYGAIGDWLYGVVAGIRVDAPGYKEILIAPRPGGGLTYVRARHESIFGPIASTWHLDDGEFRLAVDIPPNTQATVRLPHAAVASVTEGGRQPTDVPGVSNIARDGDDVLVEIGSGSYEFAYPSDALASAQSSRSYNTGSKLGVLLADAEARRILREHLPELLDSWWLSQAMGFPLERVAAVVPEEISASALQEVDRALRGAGDE